MIESRRQKFMGRAGRRQNILEIVAKLARTMYSKEVRASVASAGVNQTRAESESNAIRMRAYSEWAITLTLQVMIRREKISD